MSLPPLGQFLPTKLSSQQVNFPSAAVLRGLSHTHPRISCGFLSSHLWLSPLPRGPGWVSKVPASLSSSLSGEPESWACARAHVSPLVPPGIDFPQEWGQLPSPCPSVELRPPLPPSSLSLSLSTQNAGAQPAKRVRHGSDLGSFLCSSAGFPGEESLPRGRRSVCT